MSDAVRKFFESEKINRAEFLDWFNSFGMEGALQLVRLRFLYPEETRVKFAEALLDGEIVEWTGPEGFQMD